MKRRHRYLETLDIFCSGLYSGPNPSPGIGIARSLREAYGDARLIGVDYSPASTGLNHPVFDDLWIQRPWRELDLDQYAQAIHARLDAGAVWISGLDLECRWLASALPRAAGRLSPAAAALDATRKPAAELGSELGLGTPPTLSSTADDEELAEFCRRHGWSVWLKGPWYQAHAVSTWQQLLSSRGQMSSLWGTEELHLQAHVAGSEESVIFAAHEGRLLGASHMDKRLMTDEGKTWAGRVGSIEESVPGLLEKLSSVLMQLEWTGGGELELIRSDEGTLFLLECNPRFPAWLYGVTLAGTNLPGQLVAACRGTKAGAGKRRAEEFARIVLEVPMRSSHSLPPLASREWDDGGGKHPSGMPELSRRLGAAEAARVGPGPASPELGSELDRALAGLAGSTPQRVDLPGMFRHQVEAATAAVGRQAQDDVLVKLAYSIKTQPTSWSLQIARDHGFLPEVISGEEASLALQAGFLPGDLILNGPAKGWPALPAEALVAFADSPEELRALGDLVSTGRLNSRYVGVRLRPPGSAARFGCPLDKPGELAAIVAAVRKLPREQKVGVHMHIASSDIGESRWSRSLEAVLLAASAIGRHSGRELRMFDIGGGWTPGAFSAFLPRLPGLIAQARALLPNLDLVAIEPGKALTQPSQAIVTSVLSVRDTDRGVDAVVDASIAEVPQAWHYPHPVLVREGKRWQRLKRGGDRLLGRLCMEADVLRTDIALPAGTRSGDTIVIAEAGAYDSSMAYEFGRG